MLERHPNPDNDELFSKGFKKRVYIFMPLDSKYKQIIGPDPVKHPDWPDRIHLIINPRRSKEEIIKLVEYYYKKAQEKIIKKYKRISYIRYDIAMLLWDMKNEGMTYAEITDEVFPDPGDKWEERYDEMKAEGKSDEEIESIEDKERPSRETRIQRVKDMIKAADDLIMGGYEDLI